MPLTINPELQSLIRRLEAEEYAQLERNLLQNGCRDALVIWQEEETLLDGHNRYEICERHGLDYRIQALSLPDLDAAKAWIIANQLGRRNLSPNDIHYLRGKQYELQKKLRRGGGDRKSEAAKNQSGRSCHNDAEKTETVLAKAHNVSEKTIRNDAAFAKAIDTIAETVGPAARQTLLARESKVTQREVKQLATMAKTLPRMVQPTLEAVQAATTPKQVKKIVGQAAHEARQYEQYMAAMARSEGLADGGVPSATLTRVVPERAAPSDGLVTRFRQALRSLEVLKTCLTMVSIPEALDNHTEACIDLGKVYRQVERLTTEHLAVRNALSGPLPAPPKIAPQGRHPDYGKRTQAVEQMARTLHRFTCPEIAQHLGDDRRAVKLVLTRKVQQGKVKKEGHTYTWVEPTPNVAEAS